MINDPPIERTAMFLGVRAGKCAIALDTAMTDGLLATIPPSV